MLNADDRWAINETVSLHAHVSDNGDLDRLEEIFTPDVTYDMSAVGVGSFEGIEVVRAAARRMEANPVGPLAHHVTSIVVSEGAGDSATVESKGLLVMRDGSLETVVNRDTVVRHDGRWRIRRRVITPGHAVAPEPAGDPSEQV